MSYSGKTNWQENEIIMPEDMNRIEQGIKDNDNDINDLDDKFSGTGHKHSGAAGDGAKVSYTDIAGKPSTFPPSTHTHTAAQVAETSSKRFVSDTEKAAWNGKQSALGYTPVPNTRTVNGKALSGNISLSAADVGLGNVDNSKQATKAEFDAHKNNTTNPHGTTAAQIGAASVIYGNYTGDDTEARTINLGVTPKFVIVTAFGFTFIGPNSQAGISKNAINDPPDVTPIVSSLCYITTGGFKVDARIPGTNKSPYSYNYIAFY